MLLSFTQAALAIAITDIEKVKMPKQSSHSDSSKTAQSAASDGTLPASILNLSDRDVELARPLVAMLKNPGLYADKASELLRQPTELKALAVDLFLLRTLIVDATQDQGDKNAAAAAKVKAPKLSDAQRDKITARLLGLREKEDLPQDERINKTWREFSKKIPTLSIWQVRAYDAHITMRMKSGLSETGDV